MLELMLLELVSAIKLKQEIQFFFLFVINPKYGVMLNFLSY